MKYLQRKDGLTLIETIIALVMMLVLIAAFTGAMVVGLQSEVEVDKRLEASNLASSIIEFLKEDNRLKEKFINNDSYSLNEDIEFSEIDFSQLDEDLFFESVTNTSYIRITEYNGINDLYQITIVIKWTDRDNLWTHELVTLLAVN